MIALIGAFVGLFSMNVHPIFDPSQADMTAAFKQGTKTTLSSFGDSQTASIPADNTSPVSCPTENRTPAKISITFMPPIEAATSLGHDWALFAAKNPAKSVKDEQYQIKLQQALNIVDNDKRTISFIVTVADVDDLGKRMSLYKSIQYQLITERGDKIDPGTSPQYHSSEQINSILDTDLRLRYYPYLRKLADPRPGCALATGRPSRTTLGCQLL